MIFFFFKQKTAYEIYQCDWSSDVCSSDLANEELWEKDLPKVVEELLFKDREDFGERDKTRVVTYRAPHNSAVQIYDYKEKRTRVVFDSNRISLSETTRSRSRKSSSYGAD